MGKFLMTFVYRHPWVTAFLIWGIADTAMAVSNQNQQAAQAQTTAAGTETNTESK